MERIRVSVLLAFFYMFVRTKDLVAERCSSLNNDGFADFNTEHFGDADANDLDF
jgi:hypothetical protein